jgi:DNA-binding CsgD family transcriptional regulator
MDCCARSTAPRSTLPDYRPQGAPEFTEDDRHWLESLGPALRSALDQRWRWQRVQAMEGSGIAALDAMGCPVFVLDAGARILHANAVAADWLKDDRWVRSANGRLCSLGLRQQPPLPDAIALAARRGVSQRLLVLWGTVPPLLGRGVVSPLPVDLTGLPPGLDRLPGQPLLLVVDHPAQPGWLELVARLYGLTASEARVAQLLARGLAPKDIAVELGIEITTVRTHVRHVMSKMAVRRATEVVRLLAAVQV